MSLTVGFDDQIFRLQARGGVSRYFADVMRCLDSDRGLGVEIVAPYRSVPNAHLVEALPDRFRLESGLDRLGARLRSGRAPGSVAADVVHFTYYDPRYLGTSLDRPTVSTVHDMIPELVGVGDGPNPHLAKRDFVMRSTSIICVSEASRRDLVEVYGAIPGEVTVAHLGVSDDFRDPKPTRATLPERFVLYVGHRAYYKDFDVLLRALGAVGVPDLHLVCIGGADFSAAELEVAAGSGLADRLHHLRVSDSDLPGIYARALCLAYPSRNEGFGLPVVEAMAAGCPVLASDIPVFHETADGAADYFTPGSAGELADGIARVASDPDARRRLTEAGRVRAADFTWARTAAAHAEVYRQAHEAWT